MYKRQGYDCLKVKVGKEPEKDIARLSAIRGAVPKETCIRIDANPVSYTHLDVYKRQGLSFLTQNVLSTYQNKVLLTVGINIILAVSLNIATGYLGQLPLGHAGFMAVGAYTCACLLYTSCCVRC